MGVLAKIMESKRAELPGLRARKLPTPPSTVVPLNLRRGPTDPLRLICEIKRKSPSAGLLSTALSIEARAQIYQEHGASMISVLCDKPFFDGDYEHLRLARQGCVLPLLCKEFVLDEVQLDAARAFGASAILLIVRCLDDAQLAALIKGAQERQLTPLVEVFTEEESKRALGAGAQFVGVNARDLDTLQMDAERANRIVQSLPAQVTAAHLSGVKEPEHARQVASGRADAALIGELLMRQDNPASTLASLRAACG